MSFNYLNIDMIRKQSLITKKNIYKNSPQTSLETKTDIDKSKNYIINKNTKELGIFKDKKELTDIENICEQSLLLLEMLKKREEKDIFEKYNTQNFMVLENNLKNITHLNDNEAINNISMKKKF